jgi:hypothetical protein
MLLNILRILGALGTMATGLISLVRPLSVTGFTGLRPDGARGISEIRAVLGGLFLAVGAAALFLPESGAPQALGIAYLGTGAARLASIVVDESRDRSNLISLVWELVFGAALVLF